MLTTFLALQRTARLLHMRKNEAGASAVEYGLLVALIAAVIVAAVLLLGGFLDDLFRDTCTAIDNGRAGDFAGC